ncbi:MAG: hypothetical protein ACOC6B_01805 [Thermodesulfobacteriota bacterium]
MKVRVLSVIMIASLLAALGGCAGNKTYLIKVKFDADKNVAPTEKLVGLCAFEDLRKKEDTNLIGIRQHGDKVDFIKLQGMSLSGAVTQAVKDYFRDNGFEVTGCKGWDQSPEGLVRLPEDLTLVVGGKIDSFMVEAESGIMITDIRYTVKMHALIGKIGERTVVTRSIESMPKETIMGFDPQHIKNQLDSIVTDAINKLFEESIP